MSFKWSTALNSEKYSKTSINVAQLKKDDHLLATKMEAFLFAEVDSPFQWLCVAEYATLHATETSADRRD